MPSATGSVQPTCSFGSLLDFHQAHAAGGLQREPFVIAERRNLDAVLARDFDQQRALLGLDRLPVDGQLYEFRHA